MLAVTATEVAVSVNDIELVHFTPTFPLTARGGPIIGNGYGNIGHFKDFSITYP